MRGSRDNYGKQQECIRLTLRLYGPLKERVAKQAERDGATLQDTIIKLLKEAVL